MQSQLSARFADFTKGQRETLIAKLKCGRSTFYRWQADPGSIPLDAVVIIKAFLDKLDGADYDMGQLRKPVKLTGNKKRIAA